MQGVYTGILYFQIPLILLLLAGIFAKFKLRIESIAFVRMDLVPIAVGFSGTLLLVIGFSVIVGEKYKTEEQQIEENDERMIAIYQSAKSKAYDLVAILFLFALLTLAMFGYMNEVSFFSLVGIYFICHGYYAYNLRKNKEEM